MGKRGIFVVFEGIDRCGKTTQVARLVEKLNAAGHVTEKCNFPNRTTPTGIIIDQYLQKKIEVEDHAVHLLFSANRWEMAALMKQKLASGVSLVCDRYAFSGVAFTSAKPGFALEWCQQPDSGLPVPDLLVHLQLDQKEAEERGGFGDERYEVSDFQKKVRERFEELYGSLKAVEPNVLDVTGLSIDEVGAKVDALVEERMSSEERKSLSETLW